MKYFLKSGDSIRAANYMYIVGTGETWLLGYEMVKGKVVLNSMIRFEGEMRRPGKQYKRIDKEDATIFFQDIRGKVKELFLED